MKESDETIPRVLRGWKYFKKAFMYVLQNIFEYIKTDVIVSSSYFVIYCRPTIKRTILIQQLSLENKIVKN